MALGDDRKHIMFAKTLNCGNCGNLVDFAFHNIIDYRHLAPEELHRIRVPSSTPGRNGTAPLVRGEKGSDRATGASFAQCPRCNFPSMILFETTGLALSSLHIVGQQSKNLGLNIPVFDVLKQYPPRARAGLGSALARQHPPPVL